MRNLNNHLHLCSINTATLGHRNIYKMIDAIASHGFGGIAPWVQNLEGQNIKKVSQSIRQAGLRLSGYCRSPYIPASHHTQFKKNIEANKRCIDDALTLGSPNFIFVVGSIPAGSSENIDSVRNQVQEGIAILNDYISDSPIVLGLEPLHPMYAADRACLNTLGQAYAMCQSIDPKGDKVQVVLDTYHCWWDPTLYQQIDMIGKNKRFCAFHICDWLVPTKDFLTDRGMMGDGIIEIAKIRSAIEKSGYEDLIEVEIFSTHWWQQDMNYTLNICANRFQSCC